MKPVVVKLGGSTAGRDEMRGWISVLATAAFPLVIVPGGGPFADQVRVQQLRMGYSDDAAHAMAILGMDQFGYALAELHPRLAAARSITEMNDLWRIEKIPVWLPSTMTIGVRQIAHSWDVTSDSLAAWLCGEIGSDSLLLIKQTGDDEPISLDVLVERGIVDAMLPNTLGEGTALRIAGPHSLRDVLEHPPLKDLPGRLVSKKAFAGDFQQ